ncbi:MAG TPA: carbon monoxide dehydrogenase subunit G [Acidobacteriota bacterium]|jgi:hypothetical protein
MNVSGEYLFPAKPEIVWKHLMDPLALMRSIPGCRRIDRKGDSEFELEIEAGVGSIRGKFLGTIRLEDLNYPSSYTMNVNAQGKPGFVNGKGTIRLEPVEEKTNVSYNGEVQAGGMIASVGQRMIHSLAKKMVSDFFENLKKIL